MKKKLYILLLIAVLITFYSHYIILKEDSDKIADSEIVAVVDSNLIVSSNALKATEFATSLNAKIDNKKNMVYSSAFDTARTILCNDVLKETSEISGQKIADVNNSTNSSPISSKDSSIFIAGDRRNNISEKITTFISNAKFNDLTKKIQTISDIVEKYDTLVFSYTHKNISFNNKFEAIKSSIVFKSGSAEINVKAFGINSYNPYVDQHKALRKQIKVIFIGDYSTMYPSSYSNLSQTSSNLPEGLILKFEADSESDEIILSTFYPKNTMLETYMLINDFVNKRFEKHILGTGIIYKQTLEFLLNYKDVFTPRQFYIPLINFDLIHQYNIKPNENIGTVNRLRIKINDSLTVINKPYEPHQVMGDLPYNCIFDKPFVLYLKKHGADFPYFMAYIANDELLIKSF